MSSPSIPTWVLGASGYVAGELLRLLAGHPRLDLAGALSGSQAGTPLDAVFPHLRSAYPVDICFRSWDALGEALSAKAPVALFSCLPHGASAARLAALLDDAQAAGARVHLVDLSADFRLGSAARYAEVYGGEHGAPYRCADFFCGLPDLEREEPSGPVAEPGCFTTAVTLACAPLVALGLVAPRFMVSAVTGSTGSGRTPTATTHHPERHGNLRAYKPLAHRHRPEMEMLLARLYGAPVEVAFVPHSGPFARGIHATVHAEFTHPRDAAELAGLMAGFYAHTPFVSVSTRPPALKEVIGTNRCHLGVAAEGQRVVVMSVIDNLTKGAAGGAVQWMNRLCGLEPETGLMLPGLGWS